MAKSLKNTSVVSIPPVEVAFTKFTNKKGKVVNIPDTVQVDGVTYQVTSIQKRALRNNKKITAVNIGCYVKGIGKQAFFGCKKLKTLRISTSKLKKNTVAKKAFGKNHKSIRVIAAKNKWKSYKKIFKQAGLSGEVIYSSK